MTVDELDFLRESNNIEDEWDDKSLADAILAWQHCKKYKVLTRKVVLEVHGILMRSRDTLEAGDKGVFRTGPVYIGGREAPKHYLIEDKLRHWLHMLNSIVEYSDLHRAKDLLDKETQMSHIEYEHIHPFFDGNGRTGRIFYNWLRVKCGMPVHVIHTGKEQYDYYLWFTTQTLGS